MHISKTSFAHVFSHVMQSVFRSFIFFCISVPLDVNEVVVIWPQRVTYEAENRNQ